MSSTAQAIANRQNSLHSTGPVTVAGKAVSSQNATRHGLTSKQIVLPGEDAAEYDALRESLIEHYAPGNETERTLVEEVASGAWRLARARRHETAILRKLIGDNGKDADTAFASVFVDEPKQVDRLMRYITTIERAYYRALNKLEALQSVRKQEERDAVASTTSVRPPAQRCPQNGFVSQNASVGAAPSREIAPGIRLRS